VDDEMDASGNALLLGLLVHRYLERHQFGQGFDNVLFDNLWEKSIAFNRSMKACNDSVSDILRQKAMDQLERTVTDERLIKVLSETPDYPEASFLINVSPGVDFRGVIDRVFRNRDNGSWSIIDWKSNELRGRDPMTVAADHNYHLQLACYKYAVERITKEKVQGLYIYFTDAGFLLESEFQVNAGDVILDAAKKISEYSSGGPPPLDIQCDEIEKCRFCGYLGSFCRR
jgi:ATP-dependent exoDNAse (exonuclease V) beta subunit